MNRLASGVLVMLLCAPAWAAEDRGQRITVTGRAAGTTEAAAEEAKLDALREAVRRVCGSFINAQSETEDFALVRDKVLEHPVGFARVVKVVKGPTANEGLTEVQLIAEVFPVQFERRWAEFAHIKQREGNPRCVIVVLEDENPYDNIPPVPNGLVQTALEEFFLKQKVRLMDQGVSDGVRERDLRLAAETGDAAKAAAAGAGFKADVVVLGNAELKKGGTVLLGGHPVTRWSVTLIVRAVETDGGAILMSKTFQPAKKYRTVTGTSKDALNTLGKEVAPEVLADIGEAWRERATVSRMVQVSLEPCTRKQFKAIQAKMIESKGVVGGKDGFALRELVNKVAAIEVNWKYGINQLADRFEELKVTAGDQALAFEVTEQSANRLTIKLTQKAGTWGTEE